jgi:ABC-2 type transport system ATP-binding protein
MSSEPGGLPGSGVTESLATGREPAAVGGPSTSSNDGDELLVLDAVTKSFHSGPLWHRRRLSVLEGVSMDVRSGELVGLVGENGSGKSTLMQLIVGLVGRDSGQIERPAKLGYCPQQPLLWEKLTVAEHFTLFATAYGMERTEGRLAAQRVLEELDFARYADVRVEHLSGGTRQKLNLALALMHEPELLLLDEPYSGFDWETYLHFWDGGD